MPLSGPNLAYFAKNINFAGFSHNVKVDNRGEVRTSYVILDSDGTGSQLYQTYTVDLMTGRLRFAGRSISFPGGTPPSSDSVCWFDKSAICTGGQPLFFLLLFSSFTKSPNLPSRHLFLSSGVEITYIIVIFAVIFILAIGGLIISLFIRYDQQLETYCSLRPEMSYMIVNKKEVSYFIYLDGAHSPVGLALVLNHTHINIPLRY